MKVLFIILFCISLLGCSNENTEFSTLIVKKSGNNINCWITKNYMHYSYNSVSFGEIIVYSPDVIVRDFNDKKTYEAIINSYANFELTGGYCVGNDGKKIVPIKYFFSKEALEKDDIKVPK